MSMRFLSSAQALEIADERTARSVASSETVWSGRIVDVVEDRVAVVDGEGPVVRQYTRHPGAVAVVALRGEAGREEILLLRQYRHPVNALLWEIPAGLLDIPGEDPLVAAERELAEETDLKARQWGVLVDFFTSPGGTTEPLRVFLARRLEPAGTSFARTDEESMMEYAWVSLSEALEMVMAGRLHSPSAVIGILAASAARGRCWEGLRHADAPWFR
ncbi:ADP-ribose pyrophosphatase [Schaalia meyeri]|nr:ADP-ribose pyrophosphatase [Schaalia meyeri]